ncbi:hypothetical protein NUSPORA_01382 [Nucleospora cyclopteri]
MVNEKKRIEALAELFESERKYVDDLELWETLFRKEILNMECIPTNKKYILNDAIFSNSEQIHSIHKKILIEMSMKNLKIYKENTKKGEKIKKYTLPLEKFLIKKDGSIDTSKLEYASIFLKYFKYFTMYEEYVKKLPHSVYEFDEIMKFNKAFAKEVETFLKRNKIYDLGTNNFFYRPSTKLARYPLLIKGIIKNETNIKYKKMYTLLINKLKPLIKQVDNTYSVMSNYFKKYLYESTLQFRDPSDNYSSLGLIREKLRILKEIKLIVKKSIIQPASYKTIYIFDRFLLICNTRIDEFEPVVVDSPPIFFSRISIVTQNMDFFDKSDNLDHFFPLYLVQKEENDIKGIYFENMYSRKAFLIFFRQILNKIHSQNRNSCFNLKPKVFEGDQKHFSAILMYDPDQKECIYQNTSTNLITENSDGNSDEQIDDQQVNNIIEQDINFDYISSHSSQTVHSDVSNVILDWEAYPQLQNEYIEYQKNIGIEKEKMINADEAAGIKDIGKLLTNVLNKKKKKLDESLNSSSCTNDSSSMNETINVIGQGGRKSCCGLLQTNKLFAIQFEFNKIKKSKRNVKMYLFSNKTGIYKVVNNKTTLISHDYAKKILYNSEYQLLCYQVRNKIYLSSFNVDSTSLNPQHINIDIKNFFVGKTTEKTYIAITIKGDYNFSLIYLLEIKEKDEKIYIDLCRKLYVGYSIRAIYFINGSIIIACNDFEVVDIDTLRTQELLEAYDPFTNTFLQNIETKLARAIFKIDNETFLLCYNGLGFFIDWSGRYKYAHIYFNWETNGEYFKVYMKKVICLSKQFISVFELETGKMVFSHAMKNPKFVENSKIPLIYNKDGVFELEIDNSLKRKTTRLLQMENKHDSPHVYSEGEMLMNIRKDEKIDHIEHMIEKINKTIKSKKSLYRTNSSFITETHSVPAKNYLNDPHICKLKQVLVKNNELAAESRNLSVEEDLNALYSEIMNESIQKDIQNFYHDEKQPEPEEKAEKSAQFKYDENERMGIIPYENETLIKNRSIIKEQQQRMKKERPKEIKYTKMGVIIDDNPISGKINQVKETPIKKSEVSNYGDKSNSVKNVDSVFVKNLKPITAGDLMFDLSLIKDYTLCYEHESAASSGESLNDIVKAYEEKYKNYKMINIKLVQRKKL